MSSTSEAVIVESNLPNPEHSHNIDEEYRPSNNVFHWTKEQTEMIAQGCRNEAKPRVIRRNMENANLFSDGRVPTSLELSNKVAHTRKVFMALVKSLILTNLERK